ncbi:MAG: methylated-DNA--[protein]-cysteine S-methyltransferase [Prevotellaceae bacterium]|jgi:methylated-DNA-[protein]-cysteine S-methyltransferase|nr:methylated-DNA--[protein]-cysteine S-methyltransferase [Prevotellaceae bacterium]
MVPTVHFYASPLGEIGLASNGSALTALWFQGQRYAPALPVGWTPEQAVRCPVLAQATAWLDAYFAGKQPDFLPPLQPAGTPFRLLVWRLLQTIPHGETITYGQLATAVARAQGVQNMSAQAIGGAVGHNPISILIPCHRVVGSDGTLTGYAGGLERKKWLLDREQTAVEGVDWGADILTHTRESLSECSDKESIGNERPF